MTSIKTHKVVNVPDDVFACRIQPRAELSEAAMSRKTHHVKSTKDWLLAQILGPLEKPRVSVLYAGIE